MSRQSPVCCPSSQHLPAERTRQKLEDTQVKQNPDRSPVCHGRTGGHGASPFSVTPEIASRWSIRCAGGSRTSGVDSGLEKACGVHSDYNPSRNFTSSRKPGASWSPMPLPKPNQRTSGHAACRPSLPQALAKNRGLRELSHHRWGQEFVFYFPHC